MFWMSSGHASILSLWHVHLRTLIIEINSNDKSIIWNKGKMIISMEIRIRINKCFIFRLYSITIASSGVCLLCPLLYLSMTFCWFLWSLPLVATVLRKRDVNLAFHTCGVWCRFYWCFYFFPIWCCGSDMDFGCISPLTFTCLKTWISV